MTEHACRSCGNLIPEEAQFCLRCGGPAAAEPTSVDAGSYARGIVIDRRYEIVRLLGEGGMGVVYEAEDLRLGRRVALKMLHPELVSHATARGRMEREARALAVIEHPNVIQIRNLFDDCGVLVLELELVTGGSLSERLARGRMPLDEVIATATALASALTAIHEARLVHRDVKPANVLFSAKGVPKLADLGVAHELGVRGRTKTGTRLGTPEYMSPEQVKGQTVDERSDIYALGVVVYEMVAGRVPFEGNSEFDVLAGHVNTPPDMSKLGAVPARLRDAVARALEKSPDARWRTAAEFGAALTIKDLPPAPVLRKTVPCLFLDITQGLQADARYLALSEVIVDTFQKLMWARRPSGLLTRKQAHQFAASLSLGEHNDWRLPRRSETAGLQTGLFDHAPGWEFNEGRIWLQDAPAADSSDRADACCVRSIVGDLALRMELFVVGWETVFDERTGLMWTRFGTEVEVTQVIGTARSAQSGGYTDWRVPRKSETDTLRVLEEARRLRKPVLPMMLFPAPPGASWQRMLHWRQMEPDAQVVTSRMGSLVLTTDGRDYVPHPNLRLARTRVLHSEDVLCANDARAYLLCVRGPIT